MSSSSSQTVYHGQSSEKPGHYYTSHPPTTQATDQQSLQTYRLSSYGQDAHRPPIASSQSSASIQAAHQQRVGEQTNAILSRFYQR
ncbi:hypothetical protein F4808DRAFT_366490 [Astrocystis sublimbata]|nr:hypothetical protein F4808DRAFT_366490 [Astrocystis sublimbata]